MTKKFKRLSVVLIFAMIISVLQIAVPLTASAAAGANLVVNGDFETDATSDWIADSWTFSSDNVKWYDNTKGNTGNALKIQSTGSDSIETVSQTVYGKDGNRLPDGVYTLEAYVKAVDTSCLNSITLGVTDTGIANVTGSAITAADISTTAYTKETLENVKVINGSCNVVISTDMKSGAAWKTIVYLDDVAFYKTGEINFVQNGSFEGTGSGSTAGWNISSGAATKEAGNWGSNGETSYCMKLWDGAAYTGTVTQNVNIPAGVYTLEALVKGSGYNTVKLVAGSAFAAVNESASSFTKVTLSNITVTTPGSITVGLNADMKANGWINIDDVTLYKTSGLNCVKNGDFETDATNDWIADSWTFSSDNLKWYDNTKGRTGNALKIQSTGTNSIETVSQTAYGQDGSSLPDGIYTLEAYVKGGDTSCLNSFSLGVTDTGAANVTGSAITADGISSSEYTCITMENVEVTNGSCNVVISIDMKSGTAWQVMLYLDDISLRKVREIGDVLPVIKSVAPVTATMQVNEDNADKLKSLLPAKVTATYDTGATGLIGVTWDTVNPALYTGKDKIGTSFEVKGTVANSEIKATAVITVTNKSNDLNSDGTVNVGDLAKASYYFGSTSSSTNWSSAKAADINGDLIVNKDDLVIIANKIVE